MNFSKNAAKRSTGPKKPANTAVEMVNHGGCTSTQLRPGQQLPFHSELNNTNARRATKKSGKYGVYRRFKVATLNCRSTLNSGRLFELANGCNRYGIDMMALQEHRLQTTEQLGQIEGEDGVLIFASANKGQGGVGLFLSKQAKKRLLWHERISERIVVVHLEANPILTVIAAYSPTNCATDSEETKVREDFYSLLENTVASFPPQNVVIVAADYGPGVTQREQKRSLTMFSSGPNGSTRCETVGHIALSTLDLIIEWSAPRLE